MADNEMNYDHLAAGLKEALENDKSAFDADRLQKYTGTKSMIGIGYSIILPDYLKIYFTKGLLSVKTFAKRIKIYCICCNYGFVLFEFCLVQVTSLC